MSGFNFFDMLGGFSPLSPRVNWPPEYDASGGVIQPWMRDELVGGGGDDAPGQPPVIAGTGSGPGGMMTADEYKRSRAAEPPVPRSLAPDLYRPLDLRSTVPAAAPAPAPATAAPSGVGSAISILPPGTPAAAAAQPGAVPGLLGGGNVNALMEAILRRQLQRSMEPDWGAMAGAFARASMARAGLGAGIGLAAEAMSKSGGSEKDAMGIIKTMQEVQDLRDKAQSRKDLSASLGKLNERLAARGAGHQVNTTTGAVTPTGGIPNMTAADAGGGGDNSGGGPLDLIAKYESGGRNIEQGVVGPQGGYNPSTGTVTGPSSASGPWQMLDSTYRDAASRTAPVTIGDQTYNPSDYRRAIQAPVPVQRAVAQTLFNEQGYKPWAPYNANLRAALARGGDQVASADDRVRIRPLGGEAVPAGGAAPGGAGYDDALALLLAQIGAQSQLAGFGDVVKPYETYLYNQPGYLEQKAGAEARGKEAAGAPYRERETRLKDELDREAERIKRERDAALTIAPREQWPWEMGPNGQPQQRPITVGELAQRYRYFGPQAAGGAPAGPAPAPLAAPAAPAPAGPPLAAPAAPGGGGMGVGGALPMARPMAPAAAAGPPAAAPAPGPAAGSGAYSIPPPPEAPKEYKPVWKPEKNAWEMEPIPGTAAYQAQQNRDASELQVANRGIQSIDRALGLSSDWSTGFKGARLAGWEGTEAYNLAAEMTQLRALTSFAELQKMRAASPTGGALGAVSDTEGKKLESTLTTLDQFQSKDKVDASLRRLKEEYLDTVYGSRDRLAGLVKEGKISQRVFDSVELMKAQALVAPPGGGPRPGAPQTAPQQSAAPAAAGEVVQNGWRYDAKTHRPIGPVQ